MNRTLVLYQVRECHTRVVTVAGGGHIPLVSVIPRRDHESANRLDSS